MKKLLLSLVALVALLPSVAFANQTVTMGASMNDQTAIGGANSAGNRSAARSFVASGNWGTFTPTLCIFKSGSPVSNIIISIEADSAGAPSNTPLGTITLAPSFFGSSSCSGAAFSMGTGNATINSGSTYWLVVDATSNDASNDYLLGMISSGPGILRNDTAAGSWASLPNYDLYGSIVLAPAPPTASSPGYLVTFFDWF